MKVIRNSIFETNSSSVHSIVLVDALDKKAELSDYCYNVITKTYTIYFCDISDNGRILKTPNEKIDYLVSQVSVRYGKKDIEKYLNHRNTIVSDSVELKVLDAVKSVATSVFQVKKFVIEYDLDHAKFDAESSSVISDFIEKHPKQDIEQLFKDVILNPDYLILLTYDGCPYFKYDSETDEEYLDLPSGLIRPKEIKNGKIEVEDRILYIGRDGNDYFEKIHIFYTKNIFTEKSYDYEKCVEMIKDNLKLLYNNIISHIYDSSIYFEYKKDNEPIIMELDYIWKAIVKYQKALKESI